MGILSLRPAAAVGGDLLENGVRWVWSMIANGRQRFRLRFSKLVAGKIALPDTDRPPAQAAAFLKLAPKCCCGMNQVPEFAVKKADRAIFTLTP
jgi:hypothetical protein